MNSIPFQKSVLLLLSTFIFSNFLFAQNYYPSSGNVGVNTGNSPKFQLDVNGAAALGGTSQ